MSIKPNYEKGGRYFWIHAATLAMDFLGFRPKRLIIDTKKPKGKGYHRIAIEVVRTQRECEQLERKWAKRKARFAKKLAAHAAAKAKKAALAGDHFADAGKMTEGGK